MPTFPLRTQSGESVEAERRSGKDRRDQDFITRERLFLGLPVDLVEAALVECSQRDYEAGCLVVQPEDPNKALYLIVAGEVRISFRAAGTGPDIVLGPGEFFGEVSIIDGAQPSAWVRTLVVSTLLVVPADVFWSRFAPMPGVVRNLLAVLAERMRRANDAMMAAMRQEHLVERYQSELQLAREIQTSMLPRRFPLFPEFVEFTCHAAMYPAREVGGDFYDAFMLDDHRVFVAIGDACGKGVPAAILMARTISLLRAEANRSRDLSKVLARVNNALAENNANNSFTSIFCGILDVHQGEFTYASAGHLPPLVCWQGDSPVFLKLAKGTVAGVWKGLTYPVRKIRVPPRATLIAFTDGVTEAQSPAGDDFGDERLRALVATMPDAEVDEIVARVCAAVREFTGVGEAGDDVTVLGLRYFG